MLMILMKTCDIQDTVSQVYSHVLLLFSFLILLMAYKMHIKIRNPVFMLSTGV